MKDGSSAAKNIAACPHVTEKRTKQPTLPDLKWNTMKTSKKRLVALNKSSSISQMRFIGYNLSMWMSADPREKSENLNPSNQNKHNSNSDNTTNKSPPLDFLFPFSNFIQVGYKIFLAPEEIIKELMFICQSVFHLMNKTLQSSMLPKPQASFGNLLSI